MQKKNFLKDALKLKIIQFLHTNLKKNLVLLKGFIFLKNDEDSKQVSFFLLKFKSSLDKVLEQNIKIYDF